MSAPVLERAELRSHLERHRIAGDVATSREDNLLKYAMFASRIPRALFGLVPVGRWDLEQVIALMAETVGVSPDPSYRRGPDRIDAELTIAGLDRMAESIAQAARDRARVVVATGHPAGLLPVHLAVAAALREAGARVLSPGIGFSYRTGTRAGAESRHLRFVGGVAMVSHKGSLNHTHSPKGMQAILAALEDEGSPPPDLVVADHGWAGAAGQDGVTSVGFADSNDPALFVGEAEGRVAVSVPLDDNVDPHLYAPLTAYLLDAAGLDSTGVLHPNG